MQPDFLHVGAAKCASSWLWRVCLEHPEIYVPETPDNVNFFTVSYHRGIEWYERTYFGGCAGEKVAGEFSNSYMVFEPAMQRIARHLPDAKLTMTIRDPVERAYLQWAHIHLKKGKYGFDPAKGIGIPFEKCLHHHGHSWFRLWIDPGLYAFHIKRILRYVPRERLLVMLHDDLLADPAAWLCRFYNFLGVDESFETSLTGVDVNPDAPGSNPFEALSADVLAELHQVYHDDVCELEELLDRDLSAWKRS